MMKLKKGDENMFNLYNAVNGYRKEIKEMDNKKFENIPKYKIKGEIIKELENIVKEKLCKEYKIDENECKVKYGYGTFVLNTKYGNERYSLSKDQKMMLDGAVMRKYNDIVKETALNRTYNIMPQAIEFINQLPLENYAHTSFTNGWLSASFQEWILDNYLKQENILDTDTYKIWAADKNDDSYRTLYTSEFSVNAFYITKGEKDAIEIVDYYPLDDNLRDMVNNTFKEKLNIIRAIEKDDTIGYQVEHQKEISGYPQKAVDIVKGLTASGYCTKRGVDTYVRECLSRDYAEFMDRQIPYAKHYMQSNEVLPEISFDFSYATSPNVGEPKNFFVRYGNSRGEFTEEQNREYQEIVTKLDKVAQYINKVPNFLRDDIVGSIKGSINNIREEEVQREGFIQALENHLTNYVRTMENVYQVPENNGTVEFIYRDGEIDGLLLQGEYIEQTYDFTEEEKNEFYENCYDKMDEIDIESIENEECI